MRWGMVRVFIAAASALGIVAFSWTPRHPKVRRVSQQHPYVELAMRAHVGGSRRSSISSATTPTTGSEFLQTSTLPRQDEEQKQAQRNNGEESTPLQMICETQREFELNLGKAVDTLRKDYPKLLMEEPDFSIFDENIEVVDPSGVKLHGSHNYRSSFKFLQTITRFFYCPLNSGLTFRLVYDWARCHIRISWRAVLVPKGFYGGYRNRLHVDGISVYEFDRSSGLITRHRVERLMINDSPALIPATGMFHALRNYVVDGDGVPVFGHQGLAGNLKANFAVGWDKRSQLFDIQIPNTVLAAVSSTSSKSGGTDGGTTGNGPNPAFDREAFERKNATRKKFGLPPLTEDEFLVIDAQVRQMEMAQRKKAATAASTAAEMTDRRGREGNFLTKIFGNVLEDACESNWDCERPLVCCDFMVKKVCCSSGERVFNGAPGMQAQPIALPVPVGSGMPRGGLDGRDIQ